MFEKMNTTFVSSDCFHGFLNVCVVIAAHHNHILKGWWILEHFGCELLTKALIDLVYLLSQVCIYYFIFQRYYYLYYVPHVYIFMLFDICY